MSAPHEDGAQTESRRSGFEREAIPWMEDVYRFALSLTREPAEADNLVQETYLRAYRSWHTFQPGSDARRWLFTICRNAFLRSREKLRHEVAIEDAETETMAAVHQQARLRGDGTERLLGQIDLAPALRKAIDELPEPFRSSVILVDVEDQSYDEAAEILGVPIGTVRSRLFRGRRQLQERLLDYARDAGFSSVTGVRDNGTDE